jgi:hypothetical protein
MAALRSNLRVLKTTPAAVTTRADKPAHVNLADAPEGVVERKRGPVALHEDFIHST